MIELGRVGAVDGSTVTFDVSADARTLVIVNQLSAYLWIQWGGTAPRAIEWDWPGSGSALLVIPLPPAPGRVTLLVDYPGAVPAGDVQAIVFESDCAWAPFVGAI